MITAVLLWCLEHWEVSLAWGAFFGVVLLEVGLRVEDARRDRDRPRSLYDQ